ncbi:MAG: hypothetical protein HRU19_01800 [Pseudobacteriovorax sp.]|nr:hypothetical protein [Pseudobacteriovorax sp.]
MIRRILRVTNLSFLLFFGLALSSCDDIESTPELVDKLRAVGVAQDSLTYVSPEDGAAAVTATLTFVLVTPNGAGPIESGAAEKTDTTFRELTFAADQPAAEVYADFTLHRFVATTTIPSQSELEFSPLDGTAYFDVGWRFSIGSDVELFQSRIKVYQSGERIDPTISGEENQPLGISILNPTENLSVPAGTVTLSAELSNDVEDNYRISWLVGVGSIERIRTIETDWEGVAAGNRTVMVVVRGLRSNAFNYQVIDFVAE